MPEKNLRRLSLRGTADRDYHNKIYNLDSIDVERLRESFLNFFEIITSK